MPRLKPLPKQVRFPGGFSIAVEVAPAAKMKDDIGSYETLGIDKGIILISDHLTPRQQWRILMHELLHALADAQHYVEKNVAP